MADNLASCPSQRRRPLYQLSYVPACGDDGTRTRDLPLLLGDLRVTDQCLIVTTSIGWGWLGYSAVGRRCWELSHRWMTMAPPSASTQ